MSENREYETWGVDLDGKAMLYVHYDRNRCQLWTGDPYKARTIGGAAFSTIVWALRELGLRVTKL